MGSDVTLVGIQLLPVLNLPNLPAIPMIKARLENLGFGTLGGMLRDFARNDPRILMAIKGEGQNESGLDQFLLLRPGEFLKDVRKHPHYWDQGSLGWEPALAALQRSIDQEDGITWWLIIEY